MLSLQTIFGMGDKFYGLPEASAGAARKSSSTLVKVLQTPSGQRSLDKFKFARRREKDIGVKINQELSTLS